MIEHIQECHIALVRCLPTNYGELLMPETIGEQPEVSQEQPVVPSVAGAGPVSGELTLSDGTILKLEGTLIAYSSSADGADTQLFCRGAVAAFFGPTPSIRLRIPPRVPKLLLTQHSSRIGSPHSQIRCVNIPMSATNSCRLGKERLWHYKSATVYVRKCVAPGKLTGPRNHSWVFGRVRSVG